MTMPNREKFLGYGSSEALQAAITADEGDDFTVNEHFLFSVACSSLSLEEVKKRMARKPCGTTHGWVFSEEPFPKGEPNPTPCDKFPDSHKHFLFLC